MCNAGAQDVAVPSWERRRGLGIFFLRKCNQSVQKWEGVSLVLSTTDDKVTSKQVSDLERKVFQHKKTIV